MLEADRRYEASILCEPQMGKRGLYRTLGTTEISDAMQIRMEILAYADGRHSILDIADILGRPAWDLTPYVAELIAHGLIRSADRY